MSMNGYNSYTTKQGEADNPRQTEARALLRCAARLEAVQAAETSYFDYCDAIRQNQKLWTFIQAWLIDPDNKLPSELNETLKALSVYIDRRSLRAIGNHQPKLLEILISINKHIASGLMQQGEAEEAAAKQSAMQSESPVQTMSAGGTNIAG